MRQRHLIGSDLLLAIVDHLASISDEEYLAPRYGSGVRVWDIAEEAKITHHYVRAACGNGSYGPHGYFMSRLGPERWWATFDAPTRLDAIAALHSAAEPFWAVMVEYDL